MTGDDVVRKTRSGAPEGFFRAEAAGLRWLAAPGGIRVAEVVEAHDDALVTRRIPEAPPTRAAAEECGRALAATHAAGAAAFGAPPAGWDGPCYIGRIVLPTGSFDCWGEFYAELRVRPYADEAHRIGTLDRSGMNVVMAVCDRLTAGDFDDDAPPARIHGDLWAGNLLFGPRGAVVIDPAAHGGHGVTDLAMLALFGAPYLDRICAAYAEVAGLEAGWRELVGLHQLHPLLVHAVTHGPAYGAQAGRVAARYV